MDLGQQLRFIGTFSRNLDEKGRLTVPAKWRFRGDEAEVYLAVPNPAGFITVLPPERTKELEEKLRQISMTDTEGQEALSTFLTMMHSFGCDKQGRINLSDELMSHAGLKKEAVMVGAISSFNIYSPEKIGGLKPTDVASQMKALSRFNL